jgi:hypothetical protein
MRNGRHASRTAFWASCLVFVLSLVFVAATSDGDVPAHFDGSGVVTRTESPWSFVATMAGVGLALGVLFAGARRWIRYIPAQMINLPDPRAHRYWTHPAQRATFDHMIAEDLEWIGAATIALLTWMTVVAGTTGSDDGSVSTWVLAAPTVAYVLGIAGYAMYVIRGGKYRVPEDDRPPS